MAESQTSIWKGSAPPRILVVSHQFFPTLGGIPVIADLLMRALGELGYPATLLTGESAGADAERHSYPVVRSRNPIVQARLYRTADGCILIGPSVRSGWPLFLSRKRSVIYHQGGAVDGFVQRKLMQRACNVACSAFLGDIVGAAAVISNPFDAPLFAAAAPAPRTRDFVFAGRLVPDKGADLLLHAMHTLRQQGIEASASIVGDGHARPALEQLAAELDLRECVSFAGVKRGEALAQMLASHRFGIVPSRWQEPFGIVVLELIASGCPVIASDAGGLPEAVGPCGMTFRNGDAADLAARMRALLEQPALAKGFLESADRHLRQHHPHEVAKALLRRLGLAAA